MSHFSLITFNSFPVASRKRLRNLAVYEGAKIFQFFPSCFKWFEGAGAPHLAIVLSILSQLLPLGKRALLFEDAQHVVLFQFFPSCFITAMRPTPPSISITFQFFPSCFKTYICPPLVYRITPLSILSQLLQGKYSTSQVVELWPLSILSQLLPSCSAICEAGGGDTVLSILSQLLQNNLNPRPTFVVQVTRRGFQFFPSCFRGVCSWACL